MAGRATGAEKFSLYVLYFLISSCLTVHGIREFIGSCGLNIDLTLVTSVHSGILTMPLPESMNRYQDPSRPISCEIIISFPIGSHLLIELYFLDIMPRTGDLKSCSTGLEISDQTGKKYYGSRICMEGWQWEERHNQKQQEKLVVENSPLTLRLISSGPYRGQGFKLHFNQIRPNWPCFIQEFKCREKQRCVHDDLTCDGWDDCEDYTDERIEAGCGLLSASEICSIIMGIIILIGAMVEIVMFFPTYNRLSQGYGSKSESKLKIVSYNANMNPVIGIGEQASSQDSLPSRSSKSRRHESESDKLDKADRYNKRGQDEMSEKSSYSNPRRNRTHSQGTDGPLELKIKSGYDYSIPKGRRSSQSSLNHKKVEPLSGTDNPALENDDGQRRSKSKEVSDRDRHNLEPDGRYGRNLHNSSDSDNDRDKYKSRRRKSRNYRYSDEDSDYERGRDYRRRRRRRSYDSYSDDSEYERDIRRSRERRSRERYGDSDYERGTRRSRERDSRDKYKFKEQDYEKDFDKRHNLRDSHERSPSFDDGDEEGRIHHRRRSADRDRYTPSKNGRSRSSENVQQQDRYRESPPLPLPPPYSEEDTLSLDEQSRKLPPFENDEPLVDTKNKTTPLPASEKVDLTEQEHWKQPATKFRDSNGQRGTNDRRERYSRNRKTSLKEYKDSPPQYKEVAPTPAHTGITYREESV